MKIFKWQPPYQKDGKTTFPDARKRSGVYIIKEDNKVVYVGYSGTDLYRTMYRHFQSWTHPTQHVNTYQSRMKRHDYKVRIVYCTAKQAWALEKKLILKWKPRDNDVKYNVLMEELSPKESKYIDDVFAIFGSTEVTNECPF